MNRYTAQHYDTVWSNTINIEFDTSASEKKYL